MWFWLFEFFFKNEAFNQNFRNNSSFRLYVNLLWRSWWHQKVHFWAWPNHILKPMKTLIFKPSQAPISKNRFWSSKIRFSKSCFKFIQVIKMDPNYFPSVAEWFGINFRCLEWIWSDFEENENFEFFKHFCFVFKRILFINPSKNWSDFGFLNFFSKMKLLIKNPKR